MAKRVFLIVLDSFGVGAEPDAPLFGGTGAPPHFTHIAALSTLPLSQRTLPLSSAATI